MPAKQKALAFTPHLPRTNSYATRTHAHPPPPPPHTHARAYAYILHTYRVRGATKAISTEVYTSKVNILMGMHGKTHTVFTVKSAVHVYNTHVHVGDTLESVDCLYTGTWNTYVYMHIIFIRTIMRSTRTRS